jgi:hypothetical protein
MPNPTRHSNPRHRRATLTCSPRRCWTGEMKGCENSLTTGCRESPSTMQYCRQTFMSNILHRWFCEVHGLIRARFFMHVRRSKGASQSHPPSPFSAFSSKLPSLNSCEKSRPSFHHQAPASVCLCVQKVLVHVAFHTFPREYYTAMCKKQKRCSSRPCAAPERHSCVKYIISPSWVLQLSLARGRAEVWPHSGQKCIFPTSKLMGRAPDWAPYALSATSDAVILCASPCSHVHLAQRTVPCGM